MALVTGTRLGPYEVLAPLGAGGMGEVYRAKDSRLDREVAIKVLPEALAQDKERILRFEREARTLATLSHSNIAAIYGFEEQDGKRLLVMELADGETLADRLGRGPLPIDDSIETARKIAEALEAAHEKGIVHRDLKPANVKLAPDGSVKVLDFGLAKALLGDGSSAPSHSPTDMAHSPTITGEFTRPGVILGTAGYMSPEQARGRSVDKRTDIWAFGCVLFECLSGARLFAGETATDSIGALLHKEPEWALLPPGTPPTIQLLLRRCLAKDRNKRLRDIGDARIELENALNDPTSSMLRLGGAALAAAAASDRRAMWRRALPWAVCVILIAALGALWFATRPKPPPVMRFTMAIPETQRLTWWPGSRMDISPNGARIVFLGESGSGKQLYLRHIDQLEATPLSNTEDAFFPLFSPDGEWIAFAQKRKLRRISVLGGPATTICDAAELRGASWGADGTIVFAPDRNSGIWRVPAAGGEPVKLTDPGTGDGTPSHRWPQLLPDGQTAIFTASPKGNDYAEASIVALTLATLEQKVLIKGGSFARYVPTGHIVFARSGTLMAVPFDAGKLELTGAAIPVLEGVLDVRTFGSAQFAFSQTGTLLYQSGSLGDEERSLIWMDREGKESPVSQHKRGYEAGVRVARDGTQLAAAISDKTNTDIWVLEIERDMLTRLTSDDAMDQFPQWSPDGKWIVFQSNRGGTSFNLFRQPADGTGDAERLSTSIHAQVPWSFSPDGSILVYSENNPKTDGDILYLRLDGEERKPETFLATPFREWSPSLSPDGKWLAYASNESGEFEIYVRPFLRPGAKVKVSTAQGFHPKWSPDGKELFYRTDTHLMAALISIQDDALRAQTPQPLFEVSRAVYSFPYDVAPDGNRFLLHRAAGEAREQSEHPIVVVNWFEELQSKVRAGKE